MKHQALIDKFRACRDENDGYCDVIWLPAFPDGGLFNNVLPEPCTDILAAYLSESGYLEFLISSRDDRDQAFASFNYFPYSIQKKLLRYIFNYD